MTFLPNGFTTDKAPPEESPRQLQEHALVCQGWGAYVENRSGLQRCQACHRATDTQRTLQNRCRKGACRRHVKREIGRRCLMTIESLIRLALCIVTCEFAKLCRSYTNGRIAAVQGQLVGGAPCEDQHGKQQK
jgi:hypothetical protein